MKAEANIFGPGWPSGGAKITIEAGDSGIRHSTPDGLHDLRAWSAVRLRTAGWDGRQLQLEWGEGDALYSLHITDATAVPALQALARGRSAQASRQGMHAPGAGASRSFSSLWVCRWCCWPVWCWGTSASPAGR